MVQDKKGKSVSELFALYEKIRLVGGNLLLNAIAAAVIGGTSLFGGHGKVMSAILGAMIIASVENGMGLLGLPSGVKFVVTGLVLLAAVLVDSLSRRSRVASGIG